MLQLLAPERVAKVSDAPGQYVEDNVRAIAPLTLKKFRRGYGEEAAEEAAQLRGIAVTSAEGVLRQAKLLSKLKERLNRKEWGIWLKEVLGWFGKEVAPYLQIAKIFGKFDPAVFRKVEPFTLLKLRTKRYAPLVERLQEEINITSELIQNLISEVIPTPSRRKKAAPKFDEPVLKQRLNPEDGTFYFTLYTTNLGDQPGEWLQEKLEDRTLGQVLEHAKSLEKQVEERRDDMRSGIEAQIEQRVRNLVEMAEFALKQEIADLRAQLQNTVKTTVVGERAIATSDVTDDGASAEGRAVSANAIVGEKALATSKADDEVSASALIEPISATVGEQALAKSKALDDESSAEPLTEPAAFPALAQEPEEPEPRGEASDATIHQCPEQEAMEEPLAHVPVDEVSPLSEASSPSTEPTTAAPQDAVGLTFPVEPTSVPAALSPADDSQEITPPWKQLLHLREAENHVKELDAHIKKFNSDLATQRLDRIVSNQIRDALKNRQKLRSTKIGQIMAVADDSGIRADYEALRSSGRVVLAPSYASVLLRQCDSWSEVAMVVGSERDQFNKAVREWNLDEKQLLVQLLSSHLETESNPLEQIDWIPTKLLSRALSNFTFRLQRIKDSDNLVDDAEMEYLSGCKFVSVQNLGDRQEQWVFEFESKNIPMFDREQIAIEKF